MLPELEMALERSDEPAAHSPNTIQGSGATGGILRTGHNDLSVGRKAICV
jgi:hypothetical protein